MSNKPFFDYDSFDSGHVIQKCFVVKNQIHSTEIRPEDILELLTRINTNPELYSDIIARHGKIFAERKE